MKQLAQRILGGTILLLFTTVLFVSLFNLASGMDMAGSMSDCPFMAHEEVLCPMNLLDHITTWKSAFVAMAPVLYLLGVLVCVVAKAAVAPNLLLKVSHRLLHDPIRKDYCYTEQLITRPLQELFARGILHPKRF